MSKRVRSSRLAKGRRLRPASEAGAGEARTSDPGEVSLAPPAEASGEIGREPIPGPPDSGEVLSSRGSAARDREEDPISDVAAVASPAPPAVKAVDFDDRAAEPTRPSSEAAAFEAASPEAAARSEAARSEAARSDAAPSDAAPSEATPAPLAALPAVEATVVAPVEAAATPAPSGTSTGKKKKKKKGAAARVSDAGPAPSEAASEVAHDATAAHEEDELSHQFYSTMPPPHLDHDEDHEAARPVALTPEVLERKAKLRRIVGGICAAAALVVVMVAGKTLFENKAAPTAAPSAMVEAEAPREEPAKPEAAKPTPAPVAPVDPAKTAEDAKKAEEAEKAKAEEAEKAKAEEAEKAKAEEAEKAKGDPAELKKTASKLYNSGKLKDAIPALRAAIAADPADALYYLFLGDSLTNSGKWPEAKEAYNECMRSATKGPKHECAAMGGRK